MLSDRRFDIQRNEQRHALDMKENESPLKSVSPNSKLRNVKQQTANIDQLLITIQQQKKGSGTAAGKKDKMIYNIQNYYEPSLTARQNAPSSQNNSRQSSVNRARNTKAQSQQQSGGQPFTASLQ